MKTLIAFLLVFLAYECAGQGFVLRDTSVTSQCYVTDSIFSAPSGKVLRVVSHTVPYNPMAFQDCPPYNPVRVTVNTGCPVCGSEEARAVFAVAGLVGFQLAEIDRVWNCASCGTLYTGRRKK